MQMDETKKSNIARPGHRQRITRRRHSQSNGNGPHRRLFQQPGHSIVGPDDRRHRPNRNLGIFWVKNNVQFSR